VTEEHEAPGDKPHEPTERRLDEARRKGDAPRSLDVAGAGATAGLALAAAAFGTHLVAEAGAAGQTLIGTADRIGPLAAEGAQAALAGYMWSVLVAHAPLLLLPLAGALVAILVQGPLVLAPDKLAPRLDRISPIAGFRNRFGGAALAAFGKNLVKFALVAVLLTLLVADNLEAIIAAVSLDARPAAALMLALLVEFILWVLAIQVAVAGADLLLQRHGHWRKLRMSDRELRDEIKQGEGDPHFRAERRRRAVGIATNRMLRDVASADVVVVNPTHYAVALRWDRGRPQAPVCVAKGVDAVAARIRERAEAAAVPIRHDPPTARALYAAVGIGEEIRPDHYRAVAAAIRFAEAMRRRARARGGAAAAGRGGGP
jgi:flagellar biosynthetic protein FlhB